MNATIPSTAEERRALEMVARGIDPYPEDQTELVEEHEPMPREVHTSKIYWDETDYSNEGWAYSVIYSDGHEESGPWDCGRECDLAGEMVALMWHLGLEIRESDVAVKQAAGGVAYWVRQ